MLLLISGAHGWSNSMIAAAHAKQSVAFALPEAQPGADANQLFVMNSSRVVGGGENSELLKVDLQANKVSRETEGLTNVWDYVSVLRGRDQRARRHGPAGSESEDGRGQISSD